MLIYCLKNLSLSTFHCFQIRDESCVLTGFYMSCCEFIGRNLFLSTRKVIANRKTGFRMQDRVESPTGNGSRSIY